MEIPIGHESENKGRVLDKISKKWIEFLSSELQIIVFDLEISRSKFEKRTGLSSEKEIANLITELHQLFKVGFVSVLYISEKNSFWMHFKIAFSTEPLDKIFWEHTKKRKSE